MPSYVVFLRAVNVGKRQVRMASLREWLAEAGFTDVETYIQTGNVRVTTAARSAETVRRRVEALLLEHCGFAVPCIVFTPRELSAVHAAALALEPPPFAGHPGARRYVVLFAEPPSAEAARRVATYAAERERAWVVGRAAHIWTAAPFRETRLFGTLAGVLDPGTNRNLTVVAALAERWGG